MILPYFLPSQVENESERGATMVEYALVVALIATVCIVGFTQMGSSVNAIMGEGSDTVGEAAAITKTIGGKLNAQMKAAAKGSTISAGSFGL